MNLEHLTRAIRAATIFVDRDKETPPEDPKTRIAISFSRVRATDGKSAIHVWETESGNEDIGEIALVTRRDAAIIVARAVDILDDVEEPPISWSLDAQGFHVEEKLLPLLDGIEIEGAVYPPTDKVFGGQWASHVEGRDRFMDPKRVAIFTRAAAALGMNKLQFLLGKAQDTGMFVYGQAGALSMMAISMPLNDVEPDIRDVMTRRHP